MGLCLGTELTEEKKARIRSAKIDRDLYEFAKMEMNVVKILLLGETGKVWRPVWVVCVCARATVAGMSGDVLIQCFDDKRCNPAKFLFIYLFIF